MSEAIDSFREEHEFLSNFYPASVSYDGKEYPTVEHAFQAAKTDNHRERKQIQQCGSPSNAKKMGRRVKLRTDWETVKLGIMEALVREKFTRHPELRAALLDTEDRPLIEGNTWSDTFWGTVRGSGKNHLGKILM